MIRVSRDAQRTVALGAEFMVHGDTLSLVLFDDLQNIIVYSYDPEGRRYPPQDVPLRG